MILHLLLRWLLRSAQDDNRSVQDDNAGVDDKSSMQRAKQRNRPTNTVILSGVERERNAKRRIISSESA